ncbi:MAG: cation-translocating P-type ATPase [Actinobacteria bacterium]|nr:cation-translocating P-type ATPase [Actinomycetota bacterium]MBU1492887.1 cation-translocating P-type ATPase [Actinomycetota bacterium]
MDGASPSGPAWHAMTVAEVLKALDTDPVEGLSAGEAARRLVERGPNTLGNDRGPSRLGLLAHQFRDVLIWVLLAAALISGLLLQEWIDAGVILAIVIVNAVLGYIQEARAEDALARLRELSAPEAVVVRSGTERRIASADLVPGDLIVLEVGDRVPADCRIIAEAHFEAEESSLTGESFAVTKQEDPVPAGSMLGDQCSMVFAGTAASAGRATAIVANTGQATQVGRIAGVLSKKEPPTPLQIELDKVGRRLAVLAVATAAVVFATGMVRGKPAEAMFLTAVALAVAAIPEGLAAVVTITLSGGVQRMAARNAIVRRLPSVEALGSASVICTDKTGTLTRNEIRVQAVVLAGIESAPADLDPADLRALRFARVAALCNDARMTPDGYLGDATEVALLMAAEEAGIRVEAERAVFPRDDEIAFDSRRKRMTTLHTAGGRRLAAVKGAPEVVLDRCTTYEGPDGPLPVDDAFREQVLATAARLAGTGLRTLALAYRESDSFPDDADGIEAGLTMVALVGMSDAVRPQAAPAVAAAHRAGIAVVMVTGDHDVTARAVAAEVGILGDHEVMPGHRLREMTAEELSAEVDRYRVYSRIDPLDKVKIVEAWQRRGEIVAMTGDGVNDAPALRAADIGVAMGSGTDVAKDAADMVLADDDFASIVAAVREGRSIFSNLKTVVYFLLSCNASEVLTMFIGFLVFGALGDPLLAVQLLWINLITDGLPAVALGIDPPSPGSMERPPDRSRDILSGRRQLALLRQGTILAAAALGSLVVGNYLMDLAWDVTRTMVFTTLVVVQLAHAYSVRARATGRIGGGPGRNRVLIVGVATSGLLHLGVVYTPLGQTLFDTVGLPAVAWPVMLAVTAASFLAVNLMNAATAARRPVSRR